MSSKLTDLPEETVDSIAEQTGNYESILNLARSVPTLPSTVSLAVEMLQMQRRHFCFQRKQGIFHSRPGLSFSLWISRTPILPLLIAHQLRHTLIPKERNPFDSIILLVTEYQLAMRSQRKVVIHDVSIK